LGFEHGTPLPLAPKPRSDLTLSNTKASIPNRRALVLVTHMERDLNYWPRVANPHGRSPAA
jgi:hypothetical protein